MASKLKQPTFDTERLRLRPFRKGDLRVLHTLYSDADNLRYYVRPPSPKFWTNNRLRPGTIIKHQ